MKYRYKLVLSTLSVIFFSTSCIFISLIKVHFKLSNNSDMYNNIHE